MKKYIILALLLLPMLAFSQMQNIISQGNTATTQRLTRCTGNFDSTLMRIRSINIKNLVISMPDVWLNATIFIHSTMGSTNVTRTTINHLLVHDFQIYNNNIYFCGQYNNSEGFIGWTTTDNLFSTTPQTITLQIINNPIKTQKITEIEIYNLDNEVHVVALADNRYLIDMNTMNPSTYQIMQSNTNRLRNLSVGNKKIIALESANNTSLIITAFNKGNISQYIYTGFTHPELIYSKYVLENSKKNADIFTFAYTHRDTTNNTYYKTDFATFEVTSGISIINKQCIEIADAKLEPLDLEYCLEDTILLYLTNGHYGYDEIFPIDPFVQGNYTTTSIQPNPLINSRSKQYNSIIEYDNYYFATLAKNTNTQQGLIFDCKRNSSSFLNCATSFQDTVYNHYYLDVATSSTNYTYLLGQQNTVTINISVQSDINIIHCN